MNCEVCGELAHGAVLHATIDKLELACREGLTITLTPRECAHLLNGMELQVPTPSKRSD